MQYRSKSTGYIRSILVGMTYAAGWTPCVGPIFSAVLMLGATNPEGALLYITAYTLGFAVPFFRDGILYWEGKMDCYICQCHDENWRWNDDCNRYFIVYKSNDENYSILYSSIRWIYRFFKKMRRKKSEETNCYYTSRCSRLGRG